MRSTKIKLRFGSKAGSGLGLKGCSHGASWGGYNFYVFGIAGIIALEIDQRWGDYASEK